MGPGMMQELKLFQEEYMPWCLLSRTVAQSLAGRLQRHAMLLQSRPHTVAEPRHSDDHDVRLVVQMCRWVVLPSSYVFIFALGVCGVSMC